MGGLYTDFLWHSAKPWLPNYTPAIGSGRASIGEAVVGCTGGGDSAQRMIPIASIILGSSVVKDSLTTAP